MISRLDLRIHKKKSIPASLSFFILLYLYDYNTFNLTSAKTFLLKSMSILFLYPISLDILPILRCNLIRTRTHLSLPDKARNRKRMVYQGYDQHHVQVNLSKYLHFCLTDPTYCIKMYFK